MLIKMLTQADSMKQYRKSVEKRNLVFGAMSVLGLIMCSGCFMSFLGSWIQNDHHSGFISGAGVGLGICGVIFLIKNQKLLKDEKKLKQQWIEESDERNKMIGLKTVSTAGGWTFGLIYVGLIISFFVDMKIFVTLCLVVAVALVSLVVSRIYYERKC